MVHSYHQAILVEGVEVDEHIAMDGCLVELSVLDATAHWDRM